MITNIDKLIGHFNKAKPNDNIKIISFDIFDTLLIRKVDPPEEVKKIISDKVEKEGLLDIPATQLLNVRNMCEQQLRKQAQENGYDPECSIREIMELVAKQVGADISVTKKLVSAELKVEEALTFPMPDMKNLLSGLKNNYKLIAVSDTYLPLDLIEILLQSAGLRDFFEDIYCSCEYRLNKGSGRLFEKILEIEQISPNQIIHIGDNAISDYLIPKKLGINSIQIYDEWNLKRRKVLQHLQNQESISDYWKGFSFINKILSAQKTTNNSNETEFYTWGRNTVGPLLTLYIHLVINEIEKENINKLFFVARDGYLLNKIYDIISKKIPYTNDVSTNYIYLSRYTSFISSIKNFSKRELEMSLFGDNTCIADVMDRLGLSDNEEADAILKKNYINPNNKISYLRLKKTLEKLVKDPEFNNLVLRHSRKMRDLLNKHLRQNNMFSSKDERVAILDVGWLGTIQGCIEHAFSEHEDFPNIIGYYLALNPPIFDLSVNKKRGALRLQNFQSG